MKKRLVIIGAFASAAMLMGAAIIGYQDWQLRLTAPGNPASGFIRMWADNTTSTIKALTSAGAAFYFVADPAVPCTTCVVASSPGAGIAHFAGSTQTATSSAVNLAGADVTGTLPAANIAAVPLTTGTSVVLSGNTRDFVCTGTCTITVPVPAAGVRYCVYNDDNVATVITMSALGSSAQYETAARTAYGTAGTGTFVSGGAAGDSVCIKGRDATHYLTTASTGTWTAN